MRQKSIIDVACAKAVATPKQGRQHSCMNTMVHLMLTNKNVIATETSVVYLGWLYWHLPLIGHGIERLVTT